LALNTASPTSRWPRQIKYIIGNEACERFSYYGMTGILAGYISGQVAAGGLGKSEDYTTQITQLFIFVNYFTPLLGAWLSDKIIGRYKTIFWVSLLYCAGHGTLACSDFFGQAGKLNCLFIGLTLIAFGSGGIKPCVSAFMGEQFRPDQSHLMQKAFGAFYVAINFGSFFSFLVVPWVKDHHGYSLAFGVPGILMAIATFIFWRGKKLYVIVPTNREKKHAGFFKVFFTALFTKRAPGQKFWDTARSQFSENEVAAARSVLPILFVFATIPMFWALYNQTNSTWVLQGLKMESFRLEQLGFVKWMLPHWTFISFLSGFIVLVILTPFIPKTISNIGQFFIFISLMVFSGVIEWLMFYLPKFEIGAEQMQSLNPLLIMLFVPVFTLWIYPRLGRFASPLKRMSYGLFLAAVAFLLIAWLEKRIEAGEHLSILWQTWPYVVVTAAEVLVSTTGLEFAFREAAAEMKSLIMSFWLLTIATGSLFVAVLTKILQHTGAQTDDASVSSGRFLLYAGMMFGVAILFSLIAATYNYRDQAAARGE
jgi:POT family proton-dependent oligopeptide transporter